MSVVDTLISPQPGQVVALPLDRVRPSEHNVRTALGDVTSLAASVKAHGLLQPIVVYEADDDGTHEIVAGHRRHAAHVEAGLDTIDAIVRARPDDDGDTTAARIVENVQREDLTVADEARGYAALSRLGWPQRKIADAVGVNQSHVSKRIKLADLPDPVLEAVGAGDCRVEDALTLATLLDEDPERGAAVIARQRWRSVDNELDDARLEQRRRDVIEQVKAAHAAGDGPPLHPASDDAPWSSYSVRGVLAADHYQFRDAKVTRDRMAADGNLAVLVCRDCSIEEVCTDPAAYTPKSKKKAKPRPFEVATERRRAFLAKVLADETRDPPPAHDALAELLAAVALPSLNGQQLHAVCVYLGLDVNKSAGYRECLDLLTGLLEGDGPRSNAQVATARRIGEAIVVERGESRINGDWQQPWPHHIAHLRRVEAMGHELSDAERDWLAQADGDEAEEDA